MTYETVIKCTNCDELKKRIQQLEEQLKEYIENDSAYNDTVSE